MKYNSKIKGEVLSVEIVGRNVKVGDKTVAFEELVSTSDSSFVKVENHIYEIQIVDKEEDGKAYTAKINGKSVQIEIKSELDLLIEKMGGGKAGSSSEKKVKAPMPGLIVKIHVSQGDQIEKGQPLLNFEAMKMENQIKAPGTGTIKTILVLEGDKVEKGQMLIELE